MCALSVAALALQASALWAGIAVASTAYAARAGILAFEAWSKAPRAFLRVRPPRYTCECAWCLCAVNPLNCRGTAGACIAVRTSQSQQCASLDTCTASSGFTNVAFWVYPDALLCGVVQGGFLPEMTRREAAQILGLRETAAEQNVKDAHRRIMLANHPDSGGSSYLATKINAAKDVLLGRKKAGPM